MAHLHTSDFFKIKICKIDRKTNSWADFENRLPIKLMRKMSEILRNITRDRRQNSEKENSFFKE